MKLDDNIKATITDFNTKFPFPKTNDEDSANWTHKLCEQLAYSYPTDGWGHKSAGPGRPHSADVICIRAPFLGWDIIIAAGSSDATLNLNADSIDLTGQIYEPVAATNWLNVPVPPDPPTPPDTTDKKLDYIIAQIDALQYMVETFHAEEMAAINKPRTLV